MRDIRRKRLANVIEPLVTLTQFSADQAKQVCTESAPGYVSRTLTSLVQEGLLEVIVDQQERRYQWRIDPAQFKPSEWINRRIHGEQVTQTPVTERPREKLMRLGAEQTSTADLLAILIRVGVQGESAVTASRKLANRFEGRLEQLRTQSSAELKQVSKAITVVSHSQILAGIELGRRVAKAESHIHQAIARITSTRAAIDYCAAQFAYLANDATQEEFHILTLDTKHKPLQTHRITVGTLDASLVHPREVFRPAIRDAASAVLLVHNHPSGDPTPSREDHAVTKRLTQAGEIIGINVLDHIVVARTGCVSLRESSE
jgi:DNA repair protein RadC